MADGRMHRWMHVTDADQEAYIQAQTSDMVEDLASKKVAPTVLY